MTRYLIVVAMLAAGCEQLKSPQRIRELEDRVDKLHSDVETLKASGSAAGKPDAGAAAGSGSGEQVAAAGSGSAGSGSAGSGSAEPAAGSADGSVPEPPRDDSKAASTDAAVPDGGVQDPADRALADLRAVVAAQMGTPGAVASTADPGARTAPRPASGGPQAWTYAGKAGPPTWGTLDKAWQTCMTGKAQSPIDIEPKPGTASAIVFHYKPTAAAMFDDGHTLLLTLSPGSTIEIDGHAYQLLKVYFHGPSEHTIAGEHYPLELQLIHQDFDGRIAMIGVLYDAGAESRTLGGLWSHWPRTIGTEDKLKKPFDPSELLPETRTVFRYPGSLTQPPCSEGVIWNVMRRSMSDSKAHLEAFAGHYAHNIREVQALGGRKIE